MTERQRCQRCDEELHPDRIVWLELNSHTGEWTKEAKEWTDGPESQGWFPFGVACAKRRLKGEDE